jgi:hypothetical protein
MAKITKIQNYAILWLNYQGIESIKIADELKLTEKQVLSVLEKGIDSKVSKDSTIKTVKSSVNKSRSKDLMITQTSAKGTKNVAIMTQEASQLNDDLKKINTSTSSSRAKNNIIYRPNG